MFRRFGCRSGKTLSAGISPRSPFHGREYCRKPKNGAMAVCEWGEPGVRTLAHRPRSEQPQIPLAPAGDGAGTRRLHCGGEGRGEGDGCSYAPSSALRTPSPLQWSFARFFPDRLWGRRVAVSGAFVTEIVAAKTTSRLRRQAGVCTRALPSSVVRIHRPAGSTLRRLFRRQRFGPDREATEPSGSGQPTSKSASCGWQEAVQGNADRCRRWILDARGHQPQPRHLPEKHSRSRTPRCSRDAGDQKRANERDRPDFKGSAVRERVVVPQQPLAETEIPRSDRRSRDQCDHATPPW